MVEAVKYDILLRKGRILDPANRVDGIFDLGIKDGKIIALEPELAASDAAEVFEVPGALVVPGLVDIHVHISAWIGGHRGHKMLALAGVTTALDMAGPTESVLEMCRDHGTGLNIACLNYVRPGHTVKSTDPTITELEELIEKSLAEGALGYKLLGGHYPLTPEATARAIGVANECNAHVSFHAGSLATGSNFNGFKEAVELAGDNVLHLVHINSYCRGLIKPVLDEALEAIEILKANPNIICESYLSAENGTSSKCSDGVPESNVTKTCLETGGFPPTEAGFEEAIRAGWAQINVEAGGINTLAVGEEAVRYWRSRNTDGTVSFAINPGESRYLIATAKRDDGSFVVDAIGTDGGGIPRNTIVELGLPMVKFAGFTLEEFVRKGSLNPARMLGLKNKGHLGIGADADVAVLDWERNRAKMTIANGQLVMYNGAVVGKGTTFITTAAGKANVEKYGLTPLVVDYKTGGDYVR
jgi:dihydroorotase-like cyclic amidohydrolase